MENQEQKVEGKEEGRKCCSGGRCHCALKALAVVGLLSIGYFAGHCHRSCEVKQAAVAPVAAPAAPAQPTPAKPGK